MSKTENLRIRRTRSLVAPAVLHEELPLSDSASLLVSQSREAIVAAIHGNDPRLVVVVGPCSIHDLDAAREYAVRLRGLAERTRDKLLIVMRVYFEKPRTTVGWKGYINDPLMDGSYRVNEGLKRARQLLSELTDLGLPTATEFLDTTFGQYYSDFISWGAIGARTTESQIHRQLASGLSMPVGFKNATDGSVGTALDGIIAAGHSHLFPSLTLEGAPALLETTGNADCHLVLRGGKQPNYDRESVAAAIREMDRREVTTGLMIDCSHANSEKQHENQLRIARLVAEQRRDNRRILGLMIESHLVAGRQNEPATWGQSITDACIGWEDTESLLLELAEYPL
ncbi:MAG: 3-deoxy-7-phosphoheptulonate synthase [Proteobacteria bacterium]|nr:3-deoxy-7-phosphoheptulonate synthase [Pseudomonadota bacterium]